MLEKNSELCFDVYKKTQELPMTETELEFSVQGYLLNGLLNGSDSLITCFHESVPCLLKVLNERETTRIRELENSTTLDFAHITKFTLHDSNSRTYMIMPFYSSSLENMKTMSPVVGLKLLNQLIGSLTQLHDIGFAHMDVKSSNICVNASGDFILIDLGSVARLGRKTSSTHVYLPDDMHNRHENYQYTSSANIDWWMLAMVYVEKVHDVEIGGRLRSPTCEVIRELVKGTPIEILLDEASN